MDFSAVGFTGFYSSRTMARICRKCGLICLNPRWDEAGYAEYYRSSYYHSYLAVENLHPQPDERGEAITTATSQIAPSTASILEIGTGFGTNLVSLFRRGYSNLSGIEVDEKCCRVIQDSIPSCKIFHGTLEDYVATETGKHDLVILSHVLEHFVDPGIALKQVRKLLRSDGKLMILVPDADPPNRLLQQMTTPHTHYFTRWTLGLMLQSSGFESPSEVTHRPGEIFFVSQCARGEIEPTVFKFEFQQQMRRVRREWLTEWPNQLGRRLCEFMISERLARNLWRRVKGT